MPNQALNVYITVDTETWCGGWDNIDQKFPAAYDKYIYGKTEQGNFGLPYQLRRLQDYNLKAVFFVEPLFSMRFGKSYLEDIVGMIQQAGQSVELHLHPEWTDESKTVIFPQLKSKREHLKFFSYEEQKTLITLGIELLTAAGCQQITAFRAGSFGANNDTLRAAQDCGLIFDSSYNYCIPECEITTFADIHQAQKSERIIEVPMTTFTDGFGKRRHAQLTACSFAEIKSSLQQAHQRQWSSYVLLSHSFELMKLAQCAPDRVVIKRFEKICAYLDAQRDKFNTCFFSGSLAEHHALTNTVDEQTNNQQQPIDVTFAPTVKRYYEQLMRRVM